jgi:hypothetical protein
MERKRQEREEELRREKEFSEFWQTKMSELEAQEQAEIDEIRRREDRLANYRKK